MSSTATRLHRGFVFNAACVLSVMVVALVVRLIFFRANLYGDEIINYNLWLRRGIEGLYAEWNADNLWRSIVNHVLYNTLAMVVTHSLELTNIWTIRLPSLVAGLLAFPAVYVLCRKLIGQPIACFTAISFLALMWGHVYFSGEARAYALVFLFSTLSAWSLYSITTTAAPSAAHAALFVISVTLGALSHITAVGVFLGYGVFLTAVSVTKALKRQTFEEIPKAGLVAAWVTAVLGGLAIIAAYANLADLDSIVREIISDPSDGSDAGRRQFEGHAFLTPYGSLEKALGLFLGHVTLCAWGSVAVAALGLSVATVRNRVTGAFLICSIAGPVTAAAALGIGIQGRYYMFLMPFFVVAFGVGATAIASAVYLGLKQVTTIPDRAPKVLAGGLIAALVLALTAPEMARRLQNRPDRYHFFGWGLGVGGAENYLKAKAGPSDIVFISPIGGRADERFPRDYYRYYNIFYKDGGFGERHYDATPRSQYTVWYVSPTNKVLEPELLPADFEPELVRDFRDAFLFRGVTKTPRCRRVTIETTWNYYSFARRNDGRERSTVTHEQLLFGNNPELEKTKVYVTEKGENSALSMKTFPVVAGRLVQVFAEVTAKPRYLSIDPFYVSLRYFDTEGRDAGLSKILHGKPVNGFRSQSPWQTLRISHVVPEGAVRAGIYVRIMPEALAGDTFWLRTPIVLGDWK